MSKINHQQRADSPAFAVYNILPDASVRRKHVTAVEPVANMSLKGKYLIGNRGIAHYFSYFRQLHRMHLYLQIIRHLITRIDVQAIVGRGERVANGLLGAELLG